MPNIEDDYFDAHFAPKMAVFFVFLRVYLLYERMLYTRNGVFVGEQRYWPMFSAVYKATLYSHYGNNLPVSVFKNLKFKESSLYVS